MVNDTSENINDLAPFVCRCSSGYVMTIHCFIYSSIEKNITLCIRTRTLTCKYFLSELNKIKMNEKQSDCEGGQWSKTTN